MAGWTEEMYEFALVLQKDGCKPTVIAARLEEKYAPREFTRNSVIGKMRRKGVVIRAETAQELAHRMGTKRRKIRPNQSGNAILRRGKSEGLITQEQESMRGPAPFVPPPAAKNDVAAIFDIMKLEGYVCRWPVGDPRSKDFGYCGCKVVRGSPYCQPHFNRAYLPPKVLPRTTNKSEVTIRTPELV